MTAWHLSGYILFTMKYMASFNGVWRDGRLLAFFCDNAAAFITCMRYSIKSFTPVKLYLYLSAYNAIRKAPIKERFVFIILSCNIVSF